MKRKYSEDERKAIGLLANEGSRACTNYCQMGLNRAVIKAVIKTLHFNRRWQVNLASIICATRFKFFNKHGRLPPVACPNGCGEADSLAHMKLCYGLSLPDSEDSFQEKIRTLKRAAIMTARNSPLIPVPLNTTMSNEGELSLEGESTVDSVMVEPTLGPDTVESSLGVSLVDDPEFEEDE